jgi:hypothetical protein
MKGFKKGCCNSSTVQSFAGGGAAKGVPTMKRRGHPVAAKKAMVAPPPAKVLAPAMGAPPPLKSLVSGAMGRGAGQVALPQGAKPPLEIKPRKMVAARPAKFAKGGKVPASETLHELNYPKLGDGVPETGRNEDALRQLSDPAYAGQRILKDGQYWNHRSDQNKGKGPTKRYAAGGQVPPMGPPGLPPQLPPQAAPQAMAALAARGGPNTPLIPQQAQVPMGRGPRFR